MKQLLVGLFCACLLISGCARPSAPTKDVTGATPTGQTLMVKITGNAPSAFVSSKRGDAVPVNTDITLPYEQAFNVHGSDRFEFASGIANDPNGKIQGNLVIEIILNGKSVAVAKEGEGMKNVAHITYTVPES